MEHTKALLDQARNDTGLSDFGDDSFHEGLEILVRSLNDEAALNDTGDKVLRERIVEHLRQRLQVEDWYRRHPEIDDEVITKPLIGISLPRTGSTALSCLLAEDPAARSLRNWESSKPCPPPGTVTGEDPRRREPESAVVPPGSKRFVPSSVEGPAECQELMALDFKSHIFQAFAQIPSYSDWLLDADLTTTYLYERRVLKLLQWRCPGRPWRLKCPTHLLFLDHLDRAFPDARFVMTHRDPTAVMLSVAHLYATYVGRLTDRVDLHYLAELNVRHWTLGMERALEFREAGNDHRFYDIGFRAMQSDPVGEVRGLYQWLDEPVSDAFVEGMAGWWRENAENRESIDYPDAETYGLDLDRVRGLFGRYCQRMAEFV